MTPHAIVWTSQTLNINNFKNIRSFSVKPDHGVLMVRTFKKGSWDGSVDNDNLLQQRLTNTMCLTNLNNPTCSAEAVSEKYKPQTSR